MLLRTELKLLFRARSVMIALVAELYLITFLLELETAAHPEYEQTIHLYANVIPWALVALILSIEMVNRDRQSRVLPVLLRSTAVFKLYAFRLLLIFLSCMGAALLMDLVVMFAEAPFSLGRMMLALAPPMLLFISLGLFAAVSYPGEATAILLASLLLLPLLTFVDGCWTEELTIAQLCSIAGLLLVSGAALLLAKRRLDSRGEFAR